MYVAGVLLGEFVCAPLSGLFAVLLCAAVAALAWSRARGWLLWPLVALAGWTHMEMRTAVISPSDLRILQGGDEALVDVRGKLLDTPEQRVVLREERDHTNTLARLEVSGIGKGGVWQAAYGKVAVLASGGLPEDYYAGQNVQIHGVLAPAAGPLADGLFDYRDYLRRQGIYYELRTRYESDWTLLDPILKSRPLTGRFLAWSRATMARGLPEQDEALELLWAMTLRWKTTASGEIYEPFVLSGTMHIFAISGLHIALMAGFLIAVLRVFRVSRSWCGFIVVPLIWFYTAATGCPASAVRAAVMMSIVVGGWGLRQPPELLNSLAASALAILVFDPQQLFQAGFQLSFFVMLIIVLCLPRLKRLTEPWLRQDPLLPEELVPRWKRRIATPLRYAIGGLVTSVAAWLGAWPLTAYYFHTFSPVTVPANLVVVPLSMAALACNLGSLICGDWLPWVTVLFNHSAWFWMRCIMVISQWCAAVPGGSWYVRPPSLVLMAVYYLLLGALLSGGLVSRRRRWPGAAAFALASVYFLFAAWQEHRRTEITVLPLNGGGAVLVDAPGAKNDLLADTGNDRVVNSIVVPFLHAQGFNRISHLAVTLANERRIGGLSALCATLPAGEIVASAPNPRSAAYHQLLQFIATHPVPRRSAFRGDEIAGWSVLHPERTDSFRAGDDASLVLRKDVGGTRVLLLSELGPAGQELLRQRNPDLRSEIVVAGLPDRAEPISDALLDAIQPRLIIVVDSTEPVSRTASDALEKRLAARKIPVLYTRQTRAVTITCAPSGWTVKAMDGPTYRQ
jgi:ComEC/Rec2-related protein